MIFVGALLLLDTNQTDLEPLPQPTLFLGCEWIAGHPLHPLIIAAERKFGIQIPTSPEIAEDSKTGRCLAIVTQLIRMPSRLLLSGISKACPMSSPLSAMIRQLPDITPRADTFSG